MSQKSENLIDTITSSSTDIATSSLAYLNKKQKTDDSNFNEIWAFYQQEPNKDNRYYKATCFYCSIFWKCEKLQTMKAYLANYYSKCSEDI
ncbi:16577_t:CDS:1, partial [Racocetra fulgida]